MPLYEYYCSDCRSKFEVLTSYAASQREMVCADCHGTHVRKLISAFARPIRGGDDAGDYGDFSDGGDDFGGGGGCSCGGGSCGCHN